jgi:tetratricopeptide (TPR) repeat protein
MSMRLLGCTIVAMVLMTEDGRADPPEAAAQAPSASPAEVPSALPAEVPPTAPPPAQDTPRALARRLTDEGLAYIAEARFPEALDRFVAAHRAFPSPKLLINIGGALRYLGRNAEAAEAYEQYLAHPEAEAARRERLEQILREIDLVVGRLRIVRDRLDAEVRLDGRPIAGTGPTLVARVDPGTHSLVAHAPGHPATVKTVTVERQQELTVALRTGVAPGAGTEIRVVRTEASAQPYIGIAVSATGLAALALGAIFAGLASAADAEAAEHCVEPSVCDRDGRELGETATERATIATVAFAVGGAALAAGLVIFLTSPDDSVEAEGATALVLGPAAARFRWSW